MGCEQVVGMIYKEENQEEIEEKLNKGIQKLREIAREKDEKAIEESSYNRLYKKIKLDMDENNYWKKDRYKGEDKETWARIRCGNIGRAFKKGQADWKCRACKKENETLAHLLKCKEIRSKVGKSERKILEKWDEIKEEEEVENEICKKLVGELNEEMCAVFKEIEEILKKELESRSVVQIGIDVDVAQERNE